MEGSQVRLFANLLFFPVQSAYEATIRWTFSSSLFYFIVVNILLVVIKLHRLGKH